MQPNEPGKSQRGCSHPPALPPDKVEALALAAATARYEYERLCVMLWRARWHRSLECHTDVANIESIPLTADGLRPDKCPHCERAIPSITQLRDLERRTDRAHTKRSKAEHAVHAAIIAATQFRLPGCSDGQ